jgi:hypothetical protein
MQNLWRTSLGLVRTNLAASCPKCHWADAGKQALALAEAGKLFCWACGSTAIVVYIDPLRPPQVSAGVHEEVASDQKETK